MLHTKQKEVIMKKTKFLIILLILTTTCSFSQNDIVSKINKLYTEASKKAIPSVVTVYVEKKVKQSAPQSWQDLFSGKRRGQEQERLQSGAGSGVIISSYVYTFWIIPSSIFCYFKIYIFRIYADVPSPNFSVSF